jgi:hypothetical protein
MDRSSMKQQGVLQASATETSARPLAQRVRSTSPDGSTNFAGTGTSYLKANLSDLDLLLLKRLVADGKDFSNLTERQVVNLFL